jgi:YidC/Oxa1 family membrane protein insertase
MENRSRLPFIYLIIGVAFLFGWKFIQDAIWPPPPKQRKADQEEMLAFYAGTPALAAVSPEVDAPTKVAAERKVQFPNVLGLVGGTPVTVAIHPEINAPALAAAERRAQAAKNLPTSELIGMGWGDNPFHLRVLLNTHGGAVQQIVLSDFQEEDREGIAVKNPDGSPRPLHLIPGVKIPRAYKMREQRDVPVPELKPGKVTLPPDELEHPSYVMYHYERENDSAPVDTLAEREWRVVRDAKSADSHVVAFETELGAPFYVKITKTYTLTRADYHIGLSVAIAPTEGRPAGARVEPFRYQIDGPRGVPIEGEWYTSVHRTGVVGYGDTRALEDARQVRHLEGSDRHVSTDKRPILYAGVMVQYFASVLALDNEQPEGQKPDYVEYVRFTPEGKTHPGQTFLDDLTFRAISRPINPTAAVNHSYVLYQGPVKVRLLKQLEGDKAVPDETVNRYRDDLRLNTLTDAPMNNWLGRFSSFIFWTDLIITFTNLIHSLLFYLHLLIPNRGICIILITVMVRGLLHPFSRRQMINAKIMQAKQEKLAPEYKKLQEQFGHDPMRLQAEKARVMREHGINPAAAMGGCVLVLAQMPVFMGLYYALQESVFFRLESLTPWWIHNLAAPDMLVRWGEDIPWISKPEDLGSTLYLGPYLNLLPLIAVALMMYTQSKMMPKSDDPQIQMQQKTMKVMMVMFAFFFYKVAAGLCIYFICSSLWGMVERRLLPKNIKAPEDTPAPTGPGPKDRDRPKPAAPQGWLGKKMAGWRERWNQILEEAQKQQQLSREQRPPGPSPNGPQPGGPGPGRKKKKKR